MSSLGLPAGQLHAALEATTSPLPVHLLAAHLLLLLLPHWYMVIGLHVHAQPAHAHRRRKRRGRQPWRHILAQGAGYRWLGAEADNGVLQRGVQMMGVTSIFIYLVFLAD